MTNERPQVLIERWLPVVELGIESRREAAPIPGQFPKIKTLHVWWARRPLAAAAGTILTSLLPAWSHELVDAFPDRAELSTEEKYRRWVLRLAGVWGDPIAAKRTAVRNRESGQRTVSNPYDYRPAFKNSPGSVDLSLLHQLLVRTWGSTPSVIDPTAGGGSIPYEAARYGLPVIANDLNAVAASVLRAGVELPARFGIDLVDDLRTWGDALAARVSARVERYFPAQPGENPTNYLFARTVTCPRTYKMVPLAPTWWISKTPGKEVAARLVTQRAGVDLDEPAFDVLFGSEARAADPDTGTITGGVAMSPWDRLAISADYIKAEAQAGRMGSILYAVRVRKQGAGHTKGVRTFRPPNDADLTGLRSAAAALAGHFSEWLQDGVIPSEEIGISNYDRGHRLYGVKYWRDFFSPRQLLVHGAFVEEFRRTIAEVRSALPTERAQAVLGLLAVAQGKALDYNAMYTIWDASRMKVAHVFTKHNVQFKWTYGEFEGSRELYPWCIDQIVDAYEGIARLLMPGDSHEVNSGAGVVKLPGPVRVSRGNAGALDAVADHSQMLVCIDPPYYDNVMYGELSDFFGVWEQHTVGLIWPDLMPGGLADIKNEAVANFARFADSGPHKKKLAEADYQAKMGAIFAECHRTLRDDGVMTVMFTHKKAEAWDTLGMGLLEAGFSIETSWPVNTESEQSLHQAKKNAAASTIMLVCRKRRATDGAAVFFEDIEAEVRSTAREKTREFAGLGIGGVDLLLSSYGPALSVISRHWPVMSSEVGADGASRRLRPEEALNAAREEVVALRRRALVGRQVDFDPLTDFVLLAWSLFGTEEFPYDEARRLAMAVGGNDVETLAATKILRKKAGTVVLAKPADRRKRVVNPLLEGHITGLPLVDVLHAVMVIADADGLSAAKGVCDRLGLFSDQRFVSLIQAMVRAIPRTKAKGKFIRSESDVLDRFCTAYLPQVELPIEESDTLFTLDD